MKCLHSNRKPGLFQALFLEYHLGLNVSLCSVCNFNLSGVILLACFGSRPHLWHIYFVSADARENRLCACAGYTLNDSRDGYSRSKKPHFLSENKCILAKITRKRNSEYLLERMYRVIQRMYRVIQECAFE